jgi:hypothetical protein
VSTEIRLLNGSDLKLSASGDVSTHEETGTSDDLVISIRHLSWISYFSKHHCAYMGVSRMNPLDAILGSYAGERDEEAIDVGLRVQYPWRYTNIWTGTMRSNKPASETRQDK